MLHPGGPRTPSLVAAFAFPMLVSPRAAAQDRIDRKDMSGCCVGRAVQRFHVHPSDILILPVERSGDG